MEIATVSYSLSFRDLFSSLHLSHFGLFHLGSLETEVTIFGGEGKYLSSHSRFSLLRPSILMICHVPQRS